jgi:hypothetical protein
MEKTREMAVMDSFSKSGDHVLTSYQSNFTPLQFRSEGAVPERDATRTLFPLPERRGEMGEATFPVPAIKRMDPFEAILRQC